jgi:hypothetical protein
VWRCCLISKWLIYLYPRLLHVNHNRTLGCIYRLKQTDKLKYRDSTLKINSQVAIAIIRIILFVNTFNHSLSDNNFHLFVINFTKQTNVRIHLLSIRSNHNHATCGGVVQFPNGLFIFTLDSFFFLNKYPRLLHVNHNRTLRCIYSHIGSNKPTRSYTVTSLLRLIHKLQLP